MHKSYQSTLPSANRLLQKKWDDKYYAEHRILVRDARPSIDTRPPRTFMHLHLKLKKLQLEEERAATIERDNRILLEKMSTIMRTTGSINNRNDYEGKSLNHEKRRRELLRVAHENATMSKRIHERKPEMSRQVWQRDSSKNNAYLSNISKYAPDWYRKKSAKSFDGAGRPQRAKEERVSRSAAPASTTQPEEKNQPDSSNENTQ